jgi:hypothetical protein
VLESFTRWWLPTESVIKDIAKTYIHERTLRRQKNTRHRFSAGCVSFHARYACLHHIYLFNRSGRRFFGWPFEWRYRNNVSVRTHLFCPSRTFPGSTSRLHIHERTFIVDENMYNLWQAIIPNVKDVTVFGRVLLYAPRVIVFGRVLLFPPADLFTRGISTWAIISD